MQKIRRFPSLPISPRLRRMQKKSENAKISLKAEAAEKAKNAEEL